MTAGSVCGYVSLWACRFVIVLVVVVVVAARKHFRMNKTLVVVSNVHDDGGAQSPLFFPFPLLGIVALLWKSARDFYDTVGLGHFFTVLEAFYAGQTNA